MIDQLPRAETVHQVELQSARPLLPFKIVELVERGGFLPPQSTELHASFNHLRIIARKHGVLQERRCLVHLLVLQCQNNSLLFFLQIFLAFHLCHFVGVHKLSFRPRTNRLHCDFLFFQYWFCLERLIFEISSLNRTSFV